MIRRPTSNELSVAGSWSLLALSAACMGLSSRGWLHLLWAVYGNRKWPAVTDVYLSSITWFACIPAIVGVALWSMWYLRRLERWASLLILGMHALSVGILTFSFFAAVRPFLTTTFRMGL